MALAGAFISWGYASVLFSVPGSGSPSQTTLLGKVTSSELIAAPGISATSAPAADGVKSPVLSINSSAALYYVVGPSADASVPGQARRYYDPAFGAIDISCAPGDKFSWIAA